MSTMNRLRVRKLEGGRNTYESMQTLPSCTHVLSLPLLACFERCHCTTCASGNLFKALDSGLLTL